jgi:hypothetical protein
MSEREIHHGGCLCGAVRYEVRGRALQTTLCHCEDCRRASGAPCVAWTFFRHGGLSWIKGTPKLLIHADRERTFCGDCGSPLTFFDPSIPDLFEANTNTLDDPAAHPPADQCWTCDELPWTASIAEVPRFEVAAPLPTDC